MTRGRIGTMSDPPSRKLPAGGGRHRAPCRAVLTGTPVRGPGHLRRQLGFAPSWPAKFALARPGGDGDGVGVRQLRSEYACPRLAVRLGRGAVRRAREDPLRRRLREPWLACPISGAPVRLPGTARLRSSAVGGSLAPRRRRATRTPRLVPRDRAWFRGAARPSGAPRPSIPRRRAACDAPAR
jgi:hypothetical protein